MKLKCYPKQDLVNRKKFDVLGLGASTDVVTDEIATPDAATFRYLKNYTEPVAAPLKNYGSVYASGTGSYVVNFDLTESSGTSSTYMYVPSYHILSDGVEHSTVVYDQTGTSVGQVWDTTGGSGRIVLWENLDIEQSPAEKMAVRIHQQLNHVSRRRAYLDAKVSAAELKARDTLRDMLTEEEWRRYCTNSFVMARGESGRWYQIFSSHHQRIKVWEKGKCIAELCIHTADECPPTDHVINIKILIELDEQAVWRESNATWATEQRWMA